MYLSVESAGGNESPHIPDPNSSTAARDWPPLSGASSAGWSGTKNPTYERKDYDGYSTRCPWIQHSVVRGREALLRSIKHQSAESSRLALHKNVVSLEHQNSSSPERKKRNTYDEPVQQQGRRLQTPTQPVLVKRHDKGEAKIPR